MSHFIEKERMEDKNQKIGAFKVRSSDERFFRLFEEIREALRVRSGTVLADRMDSPKRKRIVLKCEFLGMPVVIKQEFFIFRFDRTLKAFLLGSDAGNIFKTCRRAEKKGFGKFPKIYLAAEKFSFGILRETISVTEFLEGKSLQSPLSEELKAEIGRLMADCHANGIISGDIQFENFIETPDGVKLIDFRGNKVFPWLSKARDRLQLERVFGIPNYARGFAEKVFAVLHCLRNIGRKLRGKPSIED